MSGVHRSYRRRHPSDKRKPRKTAYLSQKGGVTERSNVAALKDRPEEHGRETWEPSRIGAEPRGSQRTGERHRKAVEGIWELQRSPQASHHEGGAREKRRESLVAEGSD
jgi:hypothetical protein